MEQSSDVRAVGCLSLLLMAALPMQPIRAQDNRLNLTATTPYTNEGKGPAKVGALFRVGCRLAIKGKGESGPGWYRVKGSGDLVIAHAWKVALLVDDQTLAIAVGPNKIQGNLLGANSKGWYTMHAQSVAPTDWLVMQPGTHVVKCMLDVGHDIVESIEADNTRIAEFVVQGSPSLVPVSVPQQAVAVPPAPLGTVTPGAAGNRRAIPVSSSPNPRGDLAVMPQNETFADPTWNGQRIDWCLTWGSGCGEPAAVEFCKRSGYAKASEWQVAEDIGATTSTLVLGSAQVCSDASCDGFASITCGK